MPKISINVTILGIMHCVRNLVKKYLKYRSMLASTVPIRDGTVAKGGCTFCSVSGSGDMIVAPEAPLPVQFHKRNRCDAQKNGLMSISTSFISKNFTNTHAPAAVIRERFEQVLTMPGVVGVSIGTRPDCLPDDVVDYLAELNQRFYLWVELGLQNNL